jgi:hypothetical protein
MNKNYTELSDLRLKKNISTFNPKPIDVNWVTFEWKDDPQKRIQIGVIAQSLEHKHPEFVVCDPETGFKAVKQLQLLTAKVCELEHRIKQLEQHCKL